MKTNHILILLLTLSVFVLACNYQNNSIDLVDKTKPSVTPTMTTPEALPENKKKISKSELGNDWAFTVDEGILECKGQKEIYFTANNKTYAVNGAAKTTKSNPPVDEIWANDPKISGAKINLSSIIEKGLNLCK